jgi:hypothetical protein
MLPRYDRRGHKWATRVTRGGELPIWVASWCPEATHVGDSRVCREGTRERGTGQTAAGATVAAMTSMAEGSSIVGGTT